MQESPCWVDGEHGWIPHEESEMAVTVLRRSPIRSGLCWTLEGFPGYSAVARSSRRGVGAYSVEPHTILRLDSFNTKHALQGVPCDTGTGKLFCTRGGRYHNSIPL